MTNKIEIKPAPHEVNYNGAYLTIDDCNTEINIAIGWKVAEKITSDYINGLDDTDFKNFIKKVEEERNE